MNTQRWIDLIDKNTAAFVSSFGNLSAGQLNWRPDAGTWSIGQNIDHLIVINTSYWPVIESVRNGSYRLPWLGKVGFVVRLIGHAILRSVQPDRRRKMKTFPVWEPSSSDIPHDIIERFKAHQEKLKELVVSSGDLIARGTVISSPANRNIVYTLATAFDILVTHEQRHLAQARELADKLFSKTASSV